MRRMLLASSAARFAAGDVYRAQTNPGGSVALSGAPALDGVARGMEQAGASLERIGARQKAVDQNNENAAAAVQFAQVASEIDKAEIDGRDQAAPGGAGHSATIATLADDRISKALGGIKDPRIRSAYEARYADLRGNVFNRAYGWERAAHTDKMVTDAGTSVDTLAAGQANNPDPLGLQVSLDAAGTMWDHMDVSADIREKGKRQAQQQIAYAHAYAMADKDPDAVLGTKDTRSILEPLARYGLSADQIKVVRNAAQVEKNRLEAQQRAALSREEAAVREEVSNLGTRASRGDYSITPEEIQHAAAGVKKFGLEGPAFNLTDISDRVDVEKQYRTATPPQIHADIDALIAKGDKRTTAENLRLRHLQDAEPGIVARFKNNPGGIATAAGDPPPPVDWSNPDPKSVQSRVTWAKALAKSSGLTDVPILQPDELNQFRGIAKQGPAGQLTVAATLQHSLGIADAATAVRQIDPENKDLALMVGLHPRIGELYKRGNEAIQSGTVKLGAGPEDEQAMRDAFAKFARGMPVDMQPALMRASRAIVAGIAAEFGNSNPSGAVLTSAFEQAVQRAGGRTGRVTDMNAPGGFALWPPDDEKGRYAWLPSNITSADFIKRITRADAKTWEHAAGGEPYYMDGAGKLTKMSEAQIAHLKEYRLETVNPGVFRMIGPDDGHVVTKDGKPFQFDIRNLNTFDADVRRAGYKRI
jgi:hypothetical protein